ncbi:MAG TPA: diguanylate cyclase [Thermoanaerobaculia bacterium]|nr:diguanylate cyclase [Thermoanaerobaculia bacterium]
MPTSPPSRRRHDPPIDPPSVRVLVVDDDDNFLAWMAKLMRRLGFVVETAHDGESALRVLRESQFDLLVSDYQMPRFDGLDLIRAVRADPALSAQYAVMLTACEGVDAKVEALTAGYDDFLTKSCTEVEVIAKVIAARRLVSRQQTLADAARAWQTLATRDELTGVATRRTLFAEADEYLRSDRAIGLAILDLDDFKPINDTYGHLAGDRILRDLGALFLSRTRASDLIARYGGDEFLLLVVDLPLEDLARAAQRLICEIESLQWSVNETTISVSGTSGLAHSSLIPNATLEQLLDAADRDLYAKKWVKKHPDNASLYEYPGRSTGGALIDLPMRIQPRARVSET